MKLEKKPKKEKRKRKTENFFFPDLVLGLKNQNQNLLQPSEIRGGGGDEELE